MNKLSKSTKIVLIIIAFIVYSSVLVRLASNPTNVISGKTNDPYLSRFIENYNILKQNWYFFQSEEKVINAATQAMTNSNIENDRYTQYISSKDSKEYFEAMESSYVGVGIKYLLTREYPLVSQVFATSPAYKGGLLVGDLIISVNGKSLKNLDNKQIREIVVGNVNDKRELVVLRNGEKKTLNVVLSQIDSSVHYQIIDNIGYLELTEFSKTSASEVKKAMDYFNKQKISKVIIDLRDNPGGFLDALQEIADLFLTKDKIIIGTKDRNNNIEHYKTVDDKRYDNSIILLANKNSASASEALLACLNENSDIPIYGETSFGKGIMQGYFEFEDKGYLKYTNAEWLTPKGNAINKKGVKPTYEIKKSEIFYAADYVYNFEKDIKFDTVNKDLISYQKALKALGYKIDRVDGYYSSKTAEIINKFKKDNNIKEEDLGKFTQIKIVEKILKEKSLRKNDNVLNKVLKK